MGQAKLRGSFEQRKAAAVAREEAIAPQREQERQARRSANRYRGSQMAAFMAGLAATADMNRLKVVRETIDRSLANPGVIAVASGK